MSRPRSYRIHQTRRHQNRRLTEDRNQHYDDLSCPCWTSPKAIARFREQPKQCSKVCCGNLRRWGQELPIQERRNLEGYQADIRKEPLPTI